MEPKLRKTGDELFIYFFIRREFRTPGPEKVRAGNPVKKAIGK
jgi:hypothetical protein